MSAPMVQALLAGRKTVTRRMSRQWLKLQVGQLLWVRETFAKRSDCEDGSSKAKQYLCFRAGRAEEAGDLSDEWHHYERWIPAIHMPRWASRITLRVTEPPRLERAHDITEDESQREGVERPILVPGPFLGEHDGVTFYGHPMTGEYRDAFIDIWRKLHKKPGERWEDNPEVVRIRFERVLT
jgi:hypothetical protein